MKKRIREKKVKQFCNKNYIKTCSCGLENELKQVGSYVNEFLGKISFRYPHAECPVHGIEFASYHCCKVMEKAERKTLTKLLFENRNLKFFDYLSIEETARLTGFKEKDLEKGHIWLYNLKRNGKRIYLKESVEKHLRTKHHGFIKAC